jgi:hypothetical protein
MDFFLVADTRGSSRTLKTTSSKAATIIQVPSQRHMICSGIGSSRSESDGVRRATAEGVAFANEYDKVRTPPAGKAHITCHRCTKKGN